MVLANCAGGPPSHHRNPDPDSHKGYVAMTNPQHEALVEAVARAICSERGFSPNTLYQHNFEGDWPEDDRREYRDPFTDEPRVMLFHRAWRRYEKAAGAVIPIVRDTLAALSATAATPSDEVLRLRAALEHIRDYGPGITHGWVEHVRSTARAALEPQGKEM